MGIEQGFGANEEPEVTSEKEASQEKEYSQEELAKIGEKVLMRISEIKNNIEDLKNGKNEKFNEAVKACPSFWSKEKIEKFRQEDIKWSEDSIKELEAFIE